MSKRSGSNLPGYRATQLEFAAHIRHPELNPAPQGIDPRRMKIYSDLFYNNIENFLATTFPITKSVLGYPSWHEMVRDFMHRHVSETPYFLEIPQEFLAYLDSERSSADDPPFLLELCHYEWVELALDVADEALPESIDRAGDLLSGVPVLSPYLWLLSYRYPVHLIGVNFQPQQPPQELTLLVVYRTSSETIKFRELNPLSYHLLALLTQPGLEERTESSDSQSTRGRTGAEILDTLSIQFAESDPQKIVTAGKETLEAFRGWDIILGCQGGT